MTRSEFTSKREILNRRFTPYAWVWSIAIILVIVAAMIAADHLERRGSKWSVVVGFAGVGATLAGLIVGTVLSMRSVSRISRDLGLLCPRCRAVLLREKYAMVTTLLSGKCAKCGELVLTNTPEHKIESIGAHLLKRSEFSSEVDALTRNANRRLLVLLAIALLSSIGGAFASQYLQRAIGQGRFDSIPLHTLTSVTWAVAISGAALLVTFAVGFVLLQRNKSIDLGVPCPSCGRKLFGATAKASLILSVCVYCGEGIFEPDPRR